jgi:hypothetical protein
LQLVASGGIVDTAPQLCGHCQLLAGNNYNVYARVAGYKDWITNCMADE